MSTGWGSGKTAGPASAPRRTVPHSHPREQQEQEEEGEEEEEEEGKGHQVQPEKD